MCTHQNLAIVGFDRSFGWNWILCQTFGPLVCRRIAKRTWKLSLHYHLIKLCVLKLNPRCLMAKSSFSGMAKSPFDGFSNVKSVQCNPHENRPIFAGKTTWNPYGKLKKFTASSGRSHPRLQSARVAWATDWAHWEALEVKPWAAGCSWLIGWKSWFYHPEGDLKAMIQIMSIGWKIWKPETMDVLGRDFVYHSPFRWKNLHH